MREMREKQLAARTKAARNRKRARMGLPPETEEDEPKPGKLPNLTNHTLLFHQFSPRHLRERRWVCE